MSDLGLLIAGMVAGFLIAFGMVFLFLRNFWR
jgi:hypothetical protein